MIQMNRKRAGRSPHASLVITWLIHSGVAAGQTPFASRVIDYSPAPGQRVNDALFNVAAAALGEPFPGGLPESEDAIIVTLGGFGGAITLAFDHTVEDDPLNPLGMDAIVFGNAFWAGGDPNYHWAECATIEISLDENDNGLADDAWYLIPGSHIPIPGEQWRIATWDDNVSDATYPPDLASWIPPGYFATWTTHAYELPVELFGAAVVVNPSGDSGIEGIYGYAEYSPTLLLGDTDANGSVDDPTMAPEEFYTVPDDPLTVGISLGSGGGDAFDIAWAIDPDTKLPADLPGFDFIRLTTAVDVIVGGFGEKSAEIDAVADVAPDPTGDADGDGDIDLQDLAVLQVCFETGEALQPDCLRLEHESDGWIDAVDATFILTRITGPK